jgi:hypothetical protein
LSTTGSGEWQLSRMWCWCQLHRWVQHKCAHSHTVLLVHCLLGLWPCLEGISLCTACLKQKQKRAQSLGACTLFVTLQAGADSLQLVM